MRYLFCRVMTLGFSLVVSASTAPGGATLSTTDDHATDRSEYPPQVALSYPPPLRPGDIVWVVAPSSAATAEALNEALVAIRGMGYLPRYRPDILDTHLNFAGTHLRRQAELDEALSDTQSRAIWAVRGGYGATYLLGALDLTKVRQANKWLIGFSDISALHAAWARAGLVSMHGAVGTHLSRWSPSAQQEMATLLAHAGPTYLAGTPY